MERKLFLIFSSIALFVGMLSAQDVIIKRNGDDIRSKVTEVSPDAVKYKKFEHLTGPDYVISAAEIFMIKYENGSKDVFEKNPTSGKIQIRHIPAEKETRPVRETMPDKRLPSPSTPANPPVDIKFKNGTKDEIHTVSIGEIAKNDKGNITVELIRHHPRHKIISKNGKILLPVGMKISTGNQTLEFAFFIVSDHSIVYEFETSTVPMQITVYGNDTTGRSSHTFDAETKKVVKRN
ncbi:MAG: hypothetical protein LBC40_07680 [Dysgonamonadaceae bacterium]|jgi:hypothetical protein|nr:hypothetical protein [Dysgonamonadaceae bacterium]